MIRYSPNISVMFDAIRKASKHILRDFGELEHLQVSVKGQNDFVTNVDLKVQEIIHRELSKARPGFGFIMEEGQSEKIDSENVWIIDPIDGTINLMHGLPFFAISIALRSNNKIIAGVVYNPIQNEFYWAEDGMGAYLNNKRLRVSGRKNLDESLMSLGLPALGRKDQEKRLKMQTLIMNKVAGLRSFGAASLALALVAGGKLDGFWELGLSIWDIAAGVILIREAGGLILGIKKNEDPLATGNIIAGNPNIVYELQKVLAT